MIRVKLNDTYKARWHHATGCTQRPQASPRLILLVDVTTLILHTSECSHRGRGKGIQGETPARSGVTNVLTARTSRRRFVQGACSNLHTKDERPLRVATPNGGVACEVPSVGSLAPMRDLLPAPFRRTGESNKIAPSPRFSCDSTCIVSPFAGSLELAFI